MAFRNCGYKHKPPNLLYFLIERLLSFLRVHVNIDCESHSHTRSVLSPGYPSTLQWQKCFMTITVGEFWPWCWIIFLLVRAYVQQISANPSTWLAETIFIDSFVLFVVRLNKTRAQNSGGGGPAICIARAGEKGVISLNSRWIAMNICLQGVLLLSTPPPQFTVSSTWLHFLSPVSGERAIEETRDRASAFRTDFCFKRCLPEILCNIPHTDLSVSTCDTQVSYVDTLAHTHAHHAQQSLNTLDALTGCRSLEKSDSLLSCVQRQQSLICFYFIHFCSVGFSVDLVC